MPHRTFLDAFTETVARRPGKAALHAWRPDGGRIRVDYGELARRVVEQSRWLRGRPELTSTAEPRVALAFSDRLDLVVSMLAVLEAGAAFLPLDLELPRDRLAYLLEDAGIDLVLTRDADRGRLPETAPRTASLDALDADTPAPAGGDPRPALEPEQLAYTIYTSGSTGTPKGVLVSHRGLASLVAARPLALREDDVMLQAASPSFDASIAEIFLTLANGATLDLGFPGEAPVGAALAARLARGDVTTAILTPSVLATLPVEAASALATLRSVTVGGESCPAPLAVTWAGGRELRNAYGPTEATVCATVSVYADREKPPSGEVPLLGEALAGYTVEVTDAALRPVREGTGELMIGGDGLARGYHRRAALTASRFVPDPFSQVPGARLYRTGDLVERLPTGGLRFVGRADQQVKIHGCRVELGEIEAALTALPAIADAGVVARGDRLSAFVVARGEARPTADAMRQALASTLPPYMVPATFTVLDDLPRTTSGKLDRDALPARGASAGLRAPRGSDRTPRDPLARQLAGLWAEVLDTGEDATLDDDFFACGGHSLHAMQLTARLREQGFDVNERLLFQHPTLERLARALAEGDTSSPVVADRGPKRLPRDRPLALTAPQRQLWYLDQLQQSIEAQAGGDRAGDASYNMMVAVRFRELPLDRGALEHAVTAIVARHEVLRTRFALHDGEPRQQIDPPGPVPVTWIDASDATPRDWPAVAEAHTEAQLQRPFDLARDRMLRVVAILGPEAHRVLLIMHHIASDGWSIGVLLRELSTLYGHFRVEPAGDLPLAPLDLQYADVGHWQDRVLAGPRRAQLLDYWRRQLDGAPQQIDVPTDHPRRIGRSAENPGATYTFVLDDAQHAGLEAMGQRHGTTLFMTLLAVWSALLYRLSWQRDQLHSVPFASRLHPSSEALLGFFTNMLVIRIRLAGEDGAVRSFAELLDATRETCLDAFAHQDLPFVQLVEALQPDRRGGRMPFVQMGFALQNAFRTDRAFPELDIVPTDAHTGSARFELSLSMMQEEGRLGASFEYRSDLFEHATIVRLADRFEALVGAVLDAPTVPLDRLSCLPADERRLLLGARAHHPRPFDLDRCVHDWVADQIAARPEAESARFEGNRLTYGQLGRASARLAHRLRAAGVDAGVPVGLFLDRSLALPVAFLATLRAGGVCVPLDPDHPADRLRFMLTDTAAAVVVTQPHLRSRLPADWPGVVLDVGDVSTATPGLGDALPPVTAVGPASPAYIVYTSGSTGRPKGVLMHHRGLCNRLLWQQDAYPLSPDDGVLQNLSIGFDAAIWQLFGPLVAGASIVLPRPGGHMDTGYLARFLDREGVTCADFVPSILTPLLETVVAEHGPGWAPALRQIVSGGEALHRELADRVFATLPGVRLINIYGPTETSLTIAAATCPREGGGAVVPIGGPVANLEAYVLDPHGQPVPQGVAGEVYAGGVGLTFGYLARPRLTAERFVPHPFAKEPGARLYRTGDLARMLLDGALDYLGRVDRQVKIRGVRIELGEIEAQLGRLDGVVDAAVLARSDVPGAAPGEKRLIAYVVAEAEEAADEGTPPSAAALRTALGAHLPPTLVPGIFVFLPMLPVTVNGKVDHAKLPAPEEPAGGVGRTLVAPRDRVEAELVAIWCQALGLDDVSVTDHFFDLGGHSLLAVKLMSEVQGRLGVELDLAELYAAGTVEDMARLVRDRRRATTPGSAVVLGGTPEQSVSPPLVCVHAVDGAIHGYAHLARRLGHDTVVFGLRAPGLASTGEAIDTALLEDFAMLAAHHAEAIVARVPEGPFALCGWSTGGLLASAIAVHLEQMGRAPERLLLLDTHVAPPAGERRADGMPGLGAMADDLETQRAFFARMLLGPRADRPGEPGSGGALYADTALSEAAYARRLTGAAIGLGRLPDDADAEVVSLRWQVFRSLVHASGRYRPEPHACATVLIQAGEAPASLRAQQRAMCRTLTRGPFHVDSVATDHHGMLQPEAVDAVAACVARHVRSGEEVAVRVPR